MKQHHIDLFPHRVLLWGPFVGFAIAAALWSCIAFDILMDLVVNWLMIPALVILLGIGILELIAVPMGFYIARRARILSKAQVLFTLAFAVAYLLFAVYLSLAAMYAAI